MSASIRERQAVAIKRMLHFGNPVTKASSMEPEWKVLIYDRFGQDIISPLLSVSELRDLGVTLYLSLHSDRDPVPDVQAIYFILPTDENISRMCRDMQNQLYEGYHFNFISAIPRHKLEDLASAAVLGNAETYVTKVFDQYLNFISLEDDMFLLRNQNRDAISYYSINRAAIKDTEMMSIIDAIVDSLYCVFVCLGAIPIIRCPRGNAAEMVAERLDKKLRENIRDARNSFFSATPSVTGGMGQSPGGQFSFQRPLLVIMDRNIDLATPLHHTWTYQALIHDVLDFNLNSVTVHEASSSGGDELGAGARPKKKRAQTFNLAPLDKFWQKYKGNPFPEVAEAVQSEIEEYKGHEEEVQRLKAAMGLAGAEEGAPVDISDNTAKLTSAVNTLPELLEKKRLIDMHTTIATSVLDYIKVRKLDEYFEMEEKLMSKANVDKSLMDFISDPEAGTPDDKLRLFLIYYICQSQSAQPISDQEVDQYAQALEAARCNLEPLKYIKRWRQYSMMNSSAPQQQYRGGGTKTIGMFSHIMSTGSQFVMEGVKNLVVKKHNLPVTRIVDSLMEMKSNTEVDNYRYFDPKLAKAMDGGARNKVPYSEAIVFLVGGGNYIEYQNLMDYVKAKPGKRISYGCSELFNASQFLKQLAHLGSEIS